MDEGGDQLRRALRAGQKWGLAAALASAVVGLAFTGTVAWARAPEPTTSAPVALAELPEQARSTYRRILSGGPFPYAKDGAVFGNRERLLPARNRGYYREYTVETPGSPDRGARRIVCGGDRPTVPDACYYTGDHYASFRRIAQ
jgi:ribonuclease T1